MEPIADNTVRAWSQYHKETIEFVVIKAPPYTKHPCRTCEYTESKYCGKCRSPQLYADQIENDGRPNNIPYETTSLDKSVRHNRLFENSSKKSQGI